MSALINFLNRCADLGFGTDEEISACDTVDLVNEYWEDLNDFAEVLTVGDWPS